MAFADLPLLAFGLVLLAGVVLLLVQGLRLARQSIGGVYTSLMALRWPVATGEITRAEVATSTDAQGEIWHTPLICYAYVAGGQRYESDGGLAEAPSATTPDSAKRQIARYPVGARIAVRYDPQQPQRSLLSPFPSPWQIFGLAMGIGMVACATIGGIWLMTFAATVLMARL